MTDAARDGNSAGSALGFVVLLGVISLFAGMTCEGAQSVTSTSLGTLSATGFFVAMVAGSAAPACCTISSRSTRWSRRGRCHGSPALLYGLRNKGHADE